MEGEGEAVGLELTEIKGAGSLPPFSASALRNAVVNSSIRPETTCSHSSSISNASSKVKVGSTSPKDACFALYFTAEMFGWSWKKRYSSSCSTDFRRRTSGSNSYPGTWTRSGAYRCAASAFSRSRDDAPEMLTTLLVSDICSTLQVVRCADGAEGCDPPHPHTAHANA